MTKLSKELQTLINEVKANGQTVRLASLEGREYIYRTINRLEYRTLTAGLTKAAFARAKALRESEDGDADTAAMEGDRSREDGEEELFALAVLSPKINGTLDINGFPAGDVTKVADLIMEASGFVAGQPEVTVL